MNDSQTLYLLIRILTSGIWIAAGLYKLTHYRHTIDDMRGHGVPWPALVLPPVLVLELGGAMLLYANFFVWVVALAWLAFLLPATWLYYARHLIRNGTIDFLKWILFWKNVSLSGGLAALILLDASRPEWLFR